MTWLDSPRARQAQTAAANLYLVLAGAFVLWTVVFTLLFQFDVLFMDQWHVYVDFFRLPFWQALWHDQNQHRLFFPNLFFYLDNYAFQGTNVFLQVCILGMNAATGYLLLPWAQQNEAANRQLAKVCGGFVFVLLFWLVNRSDLAWGLGIHYYLPALTAVGACRVLASVKAGHAGGKSSIHEHLKVVLAIVFGVITTFSFGNGMSIWPALVFLALWRKLRLPYLAAILTSGAIVVSVLVLGLPKATGVSSALLLAPWKILIFMGAHVGSPIAQALREQIPLSSEGAIMIPAAVGTVAVLAVGIAGLRRLVGKTPLASVDAFHLAVVFFVLGSSAVIALGRLDLFGMSTAISPRYVIWSLLLWAAAVAAVPRMCARLCSSWHRAPGVLGALIALSTVLMLPSQYLNTLHLGFTANRVAEAGLSLKVGVKDEAAVKQFLYRLPEVVEEVAAVLRKNRWNLFSDPRLGLLEDPLPKVAWISEPLPCLGALTSAEPLPGADGDWRVKGWAWQEERRKPPQYILLTNDANQVHGLAEFTGGNLHTAEALEIYRQEFRYSILRRFSSVWPRRLRWDLGWYGYVRGAPDVCELNLYGVFDDGRTVCALAKPCDDGD